jgi:sugar/nucleoside kinase (ribokinase family)
MGASRNRPGILCVGRLYCDLIFTDVPRLPSLGTEVYAGALGVHAGGGAYITAAYLAALGERSLLSGFIPRPPFGAAVATEIEDAGIDAAFCRPTAPGHDPQVTVSVATSGDRAFLTRRAGPAFPALAAADIAARGVRHVHVGELATLAERPGLVEAAREAGATVSLDCGWDEDLVPDGLAHLLASVDVFLPNAAEVRHLERLGLEGPFAPLTVVKRGAEGASAIAAGHEVHRPAIPVTAVDTTGAGDAFNAGFLSAWLAGRPLEACLAVGNTLGARAISGRGGFQGVAPEGARADAGVLAR